ncbi:MAG: hypothetical protein EXR07_04205 [Acetobacteraceae bacterium]|nr:hypothetical protein [Acetobacteraceae bacterium]
MTANLETATLKQDRRRNRPDPNPNAFCFTVAEVRQLGGPGRTKTYELIKAGRLKMIDVAGCKRVTGDSFRALLGVAA